MISPPNHIPVLDTAYNSIVYTYQSYCRRLVEMAPDEEFQSLLDGALALPTADETLVGWDTVAAVADLILRASAVACWVEGWIMAVPSEHNCTHH